MEVSGPGGELLPATEDDAIDTAEEEDESDPEDRDGDAAEPRKDEEGDDYACNSAGLCCVNPTLPSTSCIIPF